MPYYSAYNWGTYNVTVPAYSTNVRLTVGAAGGGDLHPLHGTGLKVETEELVILD